MITRLSHRVRKIHHDGHMHSRRARPTLRVLREDLNADWESPRPRRVLAEGTLDQLHPLSELPHPIIIKAAESFGHNAAADNYVDSITSSTRIPLMEIKSGQWRGGVWRDKETGVHWLVVAGLAKGTMRTTTTSTSASSVKIPRTRRTGGFPHKTIVFSSSRKQQHEF